jgi:uncharacterized repeat protein (TIGR02543 family)
MGNIYNINQKLKQIAKVFALVFVFAYTKSWGQTTDLIFSEYIEGSSSNKYIEIYNGTGSAVNLADYKLRLYANGASSPTNDVALSGSLATCSVVIYKNTSAALTLPGGVTSTVNTAVNYNGDDALVLFKISTNSIVDIIGQIGCDPGTAWTSGANNTLDKTLVRKAGVCSGITTNPGAACGPGSFPTLSSEWDVYNIDDASHLGSHANTCGGCGTSYTVTFNTNGGTGGSMSNQTASSPTNLTSNGFTKTGCTFAGWNTAADGSGTSYANGASYSFAADLTLYAQWNCNSIITGSVSNPPFALTDCTVTASGTVDFTSSGTFTGNTYTAQLSNASGSFAAPTNIGTLISNANSGTINITIPASTASGAGYLIRVVSSNPNVTGSSSAAFTITLTCAAASGSCTVGGAMGTGYTTGCGNGSSGCNLASVYSAFGTFCSASAVACGSCPNTNVSVTYNFESGCTATITAEYKARPAVSGTACNNSAMDSGDQIFITNSGGSVSAQTSTMQVTLTTCGAYPTIGTYTTATSSLSTGCGNSDGTVSMIITGGAATIGGVSDRGDEIITYTINASGTCSLCPTLLPVGLVDFYGTKNGSNNDVFWKISMEENIEYYIIEKSSDGVNFEPLGFLPVNSISNNLIKTYKLVDETPYNDITYYRLSVRESYGVVKVYNIIYVDWSASSDWNCIHYQQEQNLMIEFKNSVPKNSNVSLFDLSGKLLAEESVKNSQTVINFQNLAEGLYFIKIQSPYKTENFKIIIQK